MCQQAWRAALVVAIAAPAAGRHSWTSSLRLGRPPPTATSERRADRGRVGAGGATVPVRVDRCRRRRADARPARAAAACARQRRHRRGPAGRRGRDVVDDLTVLSAPQPVHGFATVGVTWASTACARRATTAISVSVRTLKRRRLVGVGAACRTTSDHGPDPGSAKAARPARAPTRCTSATSTTYRSRPHDSRQAPPRT